MALCNVSSSAVLDKQERVIRGPGFYSDPEYRDIISHLFTQASFSKGNTNGS